MKNTEKTELWQLVGERIKKGMDISETVASLKRLGYVPKTIRTYFKAHSEGVKR